MDNDQNTVSMFKGLTDNLSKLYTEVKSTNKWVKSSSGSGAMYEDRSALGKTIDGIIKGIKSSPKMVWKIGKIDTKNIYKPIVDAAKSFWSKDAVVSVRNFISKSWGRISGHIDDVLGPLKGAFDFIWDTLKSTFDFFKGLGKDLFGWGKDKNLKENEKQTGFLKKIYRFFVRKDLTDAKALARAGIGGKEKKPIWYLILGAALLGLGLIIGSLIRKILLPIEMLGLGVVKLGSIGKSLGIIGGKFGRIGEWFGRIGEWFGRIGEWFGVIGRSFLRLPMVESLVKYISSGMRTIGKVGKIFLWLGKHTPLLGRLFSGLKFGFQKLAWPLSIVFAVIDFIDGFISTQGDIFEKIKNGLSSAIKGFIEMPIKLIGWVVDWILSKFGIEVAGGTGKLLLDSIMKGVDTALSIIIAPFRFVYSIIKQTIDLFRGKKVDTLIIDKVIKLGEDVITSVRDFLTNIFKKFIDIIKNLWKKVKEVFKSGERITAADMLPSGALSKPTEVGDRLQILNKKREQVGFSELTKPEQEEWRKLTTEKNKLDIEARAKSQADAIQAAELKKAEMERQRTLVQQANSKAMFDNLESMSNQTMEGTDQASQQTVLLNNMLNTKTELHSDPIPDYTDDNIILAFAASGLMI
uniref:Uncharacterized protein n=1 Tax=viral metagenome TaxID=1070528 RepID=A0A6M3K7K0_9ZZZZ